MGDTSKLLQGHTGLEMVSRRQLARWRHERIVPPGRVVGLGRGRGVRAELPAADVAQLIAAARLQRKVRSLAELRLLLWLAGVTVTRDSSVYPPLSLVRQDAEAYLGRLRKRMLAVGGRAAQDGGEEPDAHSIASEIAGKLTERAGLSSVFARRRRRLHSPQSAEGLMTALFSMALGSEVSHADMPAGASSIAQQFELYTELDKGRRPDHPELAPWLGEEVAEQLEQASQDGWLSFEGLAASLTSAPDAEWEWARDALKWFRLYGRLVPLIEQVLGKFGLSIFAELGESEIGPLFGFFVGVLHGQQTGHGEAIDGVVAALRAGAESMLTSIPRGMSLEEAATAAAR